jgi:hypothetical protein
VRKPRTRRKYWFESHLQKAAENGEEADSGLRVSNSAGRLPTVRASRLRELLVAGGTNAVAVRGVRLVGDLNLRSVTITCPLVLQDCLIEGAVNFSQADTRELEITRCKLANVAAEQATINGNFWLDGSELAVLSVAAAHIKGQLSLKAVKLGSASYPFDLGTTETTTSPVDDMPSQDREQVALMGDQLTVDQGIYCRDHFQADGRVRFPAAVIAGPLDLTGATLRGGLSLVRSRITAELDLSGAEIHPPLAGPGSQVAVSAARATVDQGVIAAETDDAETDDAGLEIVGDVRFKGAELPGGLRLDAASIVGELDLSSAHLSELDLAWCELINPQANSLNAGFAHVDRFVYCDEALRSEGALSFVGARVDGSMDLRGEFSNDKGVAVDLADARIGERLRLAPVEPIEGLVNLRHASTSEFADAEATWPSRMTLHGFTYVELHAEPSVTYSKRLQWLERDADRTRDEYVQLASFYRHSGSRKATRSVLIAGERRRRASAGPLGWIGNLAADGALGYGYAPWRALVPLVLLLVFGSLYFPKHRDEFAKLDKPEQAVEFSSPLYTLDALVPVLDFRQESTYRARDGGARTVYAALTIFGWVITTAVVAGVTNVLVRRE